MEYKKEDLRCCGNCISIEIDYEGEECKNKSSERNYTVSEDLCPLWEWDKMTKKDREK
jgi:hypothetical protein